MVFFSRYVASQAFFCFANGFSSYQIVVRVSFLALNVASIAFRMFQNKLTNRTAILTNSDVVQLNYWPNKRTYVSDVGLFKPFLQE